MSTYYEVAPCTLGFVVRPAEAFDNRRWYFEREADAREHAAYLERQDQLDGIREPTGPMHPDLDAIDPYNRL